MKGPSRFTWKDGLIRRKRKLVVGRNSRLRRDVLSLLHASAVGGHSGASATLQKISVVLYWKDLKDICRNLWVIAKCAYRTNMIDLRTLTSYNLYQYRRLAIFSAVSMDFIIRLPKSQGKDVIFVVMDRLTKYSHFIGLIHPTGQPQWQRCSLIQSTDCMGYWIVL